ncbi:MULTISPECIES: hypothetical protein [Methylosinus]|uniref:Uncharacterized protein n=1 Tax=Methylosinus trichosporium (strain ATCC 35070 / NCIMB 11131 / UNIQEM 75 / OB3b) TaxID=595536 RepID=A0A2D2CVX1_METT3|nr:MULTISPECIES: hypothetical protein [Methylosinus]ATQ66928.1 hypothetical protein CQW49_02755 [Methylosinus trichosporium OB3b]OBS54107.1 hypothetical protein A8B73_02385 [Methylosinus sp. 3S-1]
MSQEWEYQIRLDLSDEGADLVRNDSSNEAIRPLFELLAKHDAALHNQFDAFAGYVAEAEREGVENYPLYKWTKATIENPEKKAKYWRSFSLYVDGREVYPKAAADALEADLSPLVGGLVTKLAKYDSNPANNPQPPAHLR